MQIIRVAYLRQVQQVNAGNLIQVKVKNDSFI